MGRALAWVALLATCVACSRSVHQDAISAPTQGVAGAETSAPAGSSSPPGGVAAAGTPILTAGTDAIAIGAPRTIDNLTVLPILSKTQEDIGPITTLDAALAHGTAQVHEIGPARTPWRTSSAGSVQVRPRR